MASGFQNTNAFQHAGENGSFAYTEIASGAPNLLVLLLALILLVALLTSEARYRKLLERFAGSGGARAVERTLEVRPT